MILNNNFQSDKNNREILPMDQTGLPFVCMCRELDSYVDRSFPWHWHNAFEIDYLAEGELEFKTFDEEVILKKGDVIFINSGVMHSYRAVSGKSCLIYAHLFDMQFLAGMHGGALEQKYIFPVLKNEGLQIFHIRPDSYRNIRMVEKCLKAIELSGKETPGYEFEIRAQLCRFWCLLLETTKDIRSGKEHRNKADVDRIKMMMQFVEAHYMDRITLEDIAAAANISTRECTRCFRRCMGDSPVSYLNDYRIRMSARMLLQTQDSILAVSENCGFSSSSYFGKVFRETMGCTPLEYRSKG